LNKNTMTVNEKANKVLGIALGCIVVLLKNGIKRVVSGLKSSATFA